MISRQQLYRRTMVALSIFIVSATTLLYPQQAQHGVKLSLQTCRQMAVENNMDNTIAKEKTNAASYQVSASRANYLPKISATGFYFYNDATLAQKIEGGELPTFVPDGKGGMAPNRGYAVMPDIPLELKLDGAYNAALQVKQPIFMGGKITAAYNMAKKGEEMAKVNEKLSELEVIVECDEAYWNCVKAASMIKTALQYQETLQELHRMVQNAVDEGMKHRKDLLSVQVKMNEAELNLTRAENAYRLATMNLNHVIGEPLNRLTRVEDSFDENNELSIMAESFDNAEQIDVTLRPEYSLLSKQIELKEQQVKLVRSDFLPNIGVMGSFGYSNGLKMNGEKLLDGTSFSALVSVSIPLFNWGEGINKIKGAKLQSTIAQMQLQDTEEKMTLEATKALNELNEAQLEVSLTAKSVEQAQENMELSKDRYDAGMETLSDYMEAQTMWQEAVSSNVSAKAALNLSKTKYLKATGRL